MTIENDSFSIFFSYSWFAHRSCQFDANRLK
jgi:hypothetical protein